MKRTARGIPTFESSTGGIARLELCGALADPGGCRLGGFRNVLVHEYVRVDIRVLRDHLRKGFDVFPAFSAKMQRWLARQPD